MIWILASLFLEHSVCLSIQKLMWISVNVNLKVTVLVTFDHYLWPWELLLYILISTGQILLQFYMVMYRSISCKISHVWYSDIEANKFWCLILMFTAVKFALFFTVYVYFVLFPIDVTAIKCIITFCSFAHIYKSKQYWIKVHFAT